MTDIIVCIVILLLSCIAAFALGWHLGSKANTDEITRLSGDLKKATDSLADSVKKNQP